MAIAPGYFADLVVIDNLDDFNILEVYKEGNLVGKDKQPLFNVKEANNGNMKGSINIKNITRDNLTIHIKEDIANVIKLQPHSLVTEKVERKVMVKNGAIASTIAHDSHNIIVIGDKDEDMLLAIKELEKVGGGITLIGEGKIIETLPLNIGGIMSEEPLHKVDEKLDNISR